MDNLPVILLRKKDNASVKRPSLFLITRVFQIATLAVIMIQLTILLLCLDIIVFLYPYDHTWGVIFIELSTHFNIAMTITHHRQDSYQFHGIPSV